MSSAAHAAREEQGTVYWPDLAARATIVRAQRIRVTAVSGCSPKACATHGRGDRLPDLSGAGVVGALQRRCEQRIGRYDANAEVI